MVKRSISEKRISVATPQFAKRKSHRESSKHQAVWSLLDEICDPELPGISIWDLGILVDVVRQDSRWTISIMSTYSGCPAVDSIGQDIAELMMRRGYEDTTVKFVLAPAWSTEMISPEGLDSLREMKIAPPDKDNRVECPVCQGSNTRLLSQFGSTACKALYQCQDCLESFDYFKCF